MTESAFEDRDAIEPVRILHLCEEIRRDGELQQKYNYLRYEFETPSAKCHARSYLDEINTVSLFGPFRNQPGELIAIEDQALEEAVKAYLRRRFGEITKLGPAGYTTVG